MTIHHKFNIPTLNLAIQRKGHNGWNSNYPDQSVLGIQ